MNGKKTIDVSCPCCRAILTVDAETGTVLLHKEVHASPVLDITQAAKSLKEEERRRKEMFEKSLDAEKNRGDILKKKFDEAVKRAKENPESLPPPREIDLD